jgi:hypothetical protein
MDPPPQLMRAFGPDGTQTIEITDRGGSAMQLTTIGIDLAKNVFRVHGVDRAGKAALRKKVTRRQLLPLLADLGPSLVGMEACSGAH